MIGHNWGAEHAERWVWIQGADLGGERGSYFDLAAGRIKVGPVTTPWVANGMLRIDGEEHRLGGFDRILSTKLDEQPTALRVRALGQGREAPRPRLVGAAELRRLGLRRPEGPRAQHAQLLDRRPRAGGRAPRREPERLELSRRRRLRDRDAPDRPRHPASSRIPDG